MLERWKKQLFSEDGMKVVNVLFILIPFLPYAPILYGLYIWYILSDIQRVRA